MIKEINASNKYQKGKMYIYRNSRSKNEEEQWTAVFVNDSEEPVSSKLNWYTVIILSIQLKQNRKT